MKLSKRLFTAASMVTKGNRLADIGTDHGYIPIWLVSNGVIPGALAMDIGKGPLDRARDHIRAEHLEEYIETRLSDGLQELKPFEADSILIAGMGGMVIKNILKQGEEKLRGVKELILAPQSEVDKVRRYVIECGYQIDKEAFVEDAGKYYPIIHVRLEPKIEGSTVQWEDWEYLYGKIPVADQNSTLLEMLLKKEDTLRQINDRLKGDSKEIRDRKAELASELEMISKAKQAMV